MECIDQIYFERSSVMEKKKTDRVEGDIIILHDDDIPGPKVLKIVKIIMPSGKDRTYTIRKTINSGYLFN